MWFSLGMALAFNADSAHFLLFTFSLVLETGTFCGAFYSCSKIFIV